MSKTTPSRRIRDLDEKKLRRVVLIQGLQLKAVTRENKALRDKIHLMESIHSGPFRFFLKLAYTCEVILSNIKRLFRRS